MTIRGWLSAIRAIGQRERAEDAPAVPLPEPPIQFCQDCKHCEPAASIPEGHDDRYAYAQCLASGIVNGSKLTALHIVRETTGHDYCTVVRQYLQPDPRWCSFYEAAKPPAAHFPASPEHNSPTQHIETIS